MERREVLFSSGTDRCAAWFYPAAGAPPRSPIVVMAHGLSGTRRDRLGAFATRFARAGLAVLVFDHRGFGDSGGEPDLFHPRMQLEGGGNALRGRHIRVVGQPHEAALINAPGGEAGWRRVVAMGEDSRWRDRVSSRWILRAPYRPARHARRLHCPWLVCVGEADRVARPGPAIAAARRAPLGELRTYPGVDHFDIYDGPQHELLVADQLEFLRRHLLG